MKDRIELLEPHKPLTVSPNDTIGAVLRKMVAEIDRLRHGDGRG